MANHPYFFFDKKELPDTIFITGIGTDVGKTVVSTKLVEYLEADYWKPVQSGLPADTDKVKSLLSKTHTYTLHKEAYRFQEPASPHLSARLENAHIEPERIILPKTNKRLIIEGAGGLLVPLNDNGYLYADWLEAHKLPTILVTSNYLGSINHTLLSINELKRRQIPLLGLIYSGVANPETEKIIEITSGIKTLGKIPLLRNL